MPGSGLFRAERERSDELPVSVGFRHFRSGIRPA
jgi:hypothetical protein